MDHSRTPTTEKQIVLLRCNSAEPNPSARPTARPKAPPPKWIALASFALSHLTAPAQDSVQWATNYYSVVGASLPEIRRSMAETRPWKERQAIDARTEWRVKWQFTVSSSDRGCYCNTFSTITTITMTLPRWIAPTNAPDSLKAIWQRYIAALGKHEGGHAQIGLAAAAELQRRSRAFGTSPDCEGFKAKINAVGEDVLRHFRLRDTEYDERTRHGATEGAFLPGGGRGRDGPPRRERE